MKFLISRRHPERFVKNAWPVFTKVSTRPKITSRAVVLCVGGDPGLLSFLVLFVTLAMPMEILSAGSFRLPRAAPVASRYAPSARPASRASALPPATPPPRGSVLLGGTPVEQGDVALYASPLGRAIGGTAADQAALEAARRALAHETGGGTFAQHDTHGDDAMRAAGLARQRAALAAGAGSGVLPAVRGVPAFTSVVPPGGGPAAPRHRPTRGPPGISAASVAQGGDPLAAPPALVPGAAAVGVPRGPRAPRSLPPVSPSGSTDSDPLERLLGLPGDLAPAAGDSPPSGEMPERLGRGSPVARSLPLPSPTPQPEVRSPEATPAGIRGLREPLKSPLPPPSPVTPSADAAAAARRRGAGVTVGVDVDPAALPYVDPRLRDPNDTSWLDRDWTALADVARRARAGGGVDAADGVASPAVGAPGDSAVGDDAAATAVTGSLGVGSRRPPRRRRTEAVDGD